MSDTSHMPSCPHCNGQDLWRRGRNRAGLQQWFCKSCERQFVIDSRQQDLKKVAGRLIVAGVPVPKIAEAMSGFISRRTLYRIRRELNG